MGSHLQLHALERAGAGGLQAHEDVAGLPRFERHARRAAAGACRDRRGLRADENRQRRGRILHRQGQRGAREVRYSDLRYGLGDIDDLLDGSGQGDRAIGRAAERAAARPCPPAVEAVAARRERPACEPALVHEKAGIDEKVRPRHVGNAAGKRCDAARALDQACASRHSLPSGETRMRKSSLPIKPGLRAAAEAALVELREHVAVSALLLSTKRRSPVPPSASAKAVNRAALSFAERRFRPSAAVPMPSRCEVVDLLRDGTHSLPIRAVEEDEQLLRLHIDEPSGARREEPPGAEIEQGDLAGLAGEGAGGVRRRRGSGRLPSGEAGGALRPRSLTASCTSASRAASASLWVTCFCACAAARSGRARWGVDDIGMVPRRHGNRW